MTLKVKYQEGSDRIKSKKIYCLNGIKRKGCRKGSKGISEKAVTEIVEQNLRNTINRMVDKNKMKEQIVKQYDEETGNSLVSQKEMLSKELQKVEEKMKTLYLDYRKDLLEEEDYKKFYREMAEQKERIQREIKEIEKQEENKSILSESKVQQVVEEIMDMKELTKDRIADLIDSIEIDYHNNIFINYKYKIEKAIGV